MSDETPARRVARLEAELADAKVKRLEAELAEAKLDQGDAEPRRPAPDDHTLAPVPRRVPGSFALAECLRWSWWNVWAMFGIGVGGMAAWIFAPRAFALVGTVTLVVIALVRLRAARERFALLRWGKVADVVGTSVIREGTYYSGTTYNNMIIPVAHGWLVERSVYNGPKVVTRIRYRLGGSEHELIFGGRAYEDGVILAHSRQPELALCVSSFPYDLHCDNDGNWLGTLRTGLRVGMIAMTLFVAAWIVAIVILARH